MFKRIGLIVLVLALALPVVAVAAEGASEVTLTGEVLDLACYLSHGKKGKSHAACARACVKGGQPMGLLTDEGVVLLAADHADGAPFEQTKTHAGQSVTITGMMFESSDIKMVEVKSVQAE